MNLTIPGTIRDQIVDRRNKLEAAVSVRGRRADLVQLIEEVDAALERFDAGTYGLCETCQQPIETERVLADPLVRFCLDHLTPGEQRALEQDLELASRIQRGLLPDVRQVGDGWDIAYDYRPARIVSGDYCDIIPAENAVYFFLGDVSGKGVAASLLMAHLHAMMRALVSVQLPLERLLERASRVFCESTLPTHYATMVCGRATGGGEIEICNAGHLAVIVDREDGSTLVESTGLPVGLFRAEQFTTQRVGLSRGDILVLCTDGVTEAENAQGRPYGIERLAAVVRRHRGSSADAIVQACTRDLSAHRSGLQQDDVTLMVIGRSE